MAGVPPLRKRNVKCGRPPRVSTRAKQNRGTRGKGLAGSQGKARRKSPSGWRRSRPRWDSFTARARRGSRGKQVLFPGQRSPALGRSPGPAGLEGVNQRGSTSQDGPAALLPQPPLGQGAAQTETVPLRQQGPQVHPASRPCQVPPVQAPLPGAQLQNDLHAAPLSVPAHHLTALQGKPLLHGASLLSSFTLCLTGVKNPAPEKGRDRKTGSCYQSPESKPFGHFF